MLELESGLRGVGSGFAVPLVGVEVAAEVRGAASRVRLTQRYRNDEAQPIEAVYVFPLDEGAALCGFEATVGERHIVGRIAERDDAFEQYDDALMAGHGAFLLDQERPNVFTASVGNLPPGAEAAITLTYVAELAREGDALRFLLPTTVAPRYVPLDHEVEIGQPGDERVNPPLAAALPYRLTLSVSVEQPGGVKAVSSPSHGIRVEHDGPRALVTLGGEDAAMDRDFVLLIEPAMRQAAGGVTEVGADGAITAAVTLLPAFEQSARPAEVIFVLDCSGSMAGDSIDQAKRALRLCLRQMTAADAFNVVGFGSGFVALFERPRRWDHPAFEEADRWVESLDAHMGGTEILAPLQAVLTLPVDTDRQRVVVLLTDGEVSNEDQVIALAAEHRSTTRLFAFGIGAGPSEHLVRGVARAGGGAAEFIAPGERIEPKVLRQFARLTSPRLEHLTLLPDDLASAPRELPAVYAGEAITVYVRGRGVPPVLTLMAEGLGTQMVVLPAPTPGALLSTLWARATLRDLEEGVAGGSAQTGRRDASRRRKVCDLALAYGLASSATSFVAVEERAPGERTTEAAELRRVPVALTHGWGGDAVQPLQPRMPMPTPMPMAELPAGMVAFCASAPPPPARGRARRRGEPLHLQLLMAQLPDGAFEWADVVALAQPEDEAAAELEVVCLDPRVKATFLALALLRVRCRAARVEWQLAAAKAETWLRDVAGADGMRIEGHEALDWFEAHLR